MLLSKKRLDVFTSAFGGDVSGRAQVLCTSGLIHITIVHPLSP
jgi:hypothetical protein